MFSNSSRMQVNHRISAFIFLLLTIASAIKTDTDGDTRNTFAQLFNYNQQDYTWEHVKSEIYGLLGRLVNPFGRKFHPSEIPPCAQPPCIPTQTVVEEVRKNAGIIEFDGRIDFHLSRKIWIIAAKGNEYLSRVRFKLVENHLGNSAKLSLSNVGAGKHVHFSSQDGLTGQRGFVSLHLLLVTLTLGNTTANSTPTRFKLKYNVIRRKHHLITSTEVMRRNGLQSVSYPPQNNHNYSLESNFFAVMAPPHGKNFRLTMKYLDIPYTPSDTFGFRSCFRIWYLHDSQYNTHFSEQFNFGEFGLRGNISELIGFPTVAVIQFSPSFLAIATEAGRGFRLEVDNSN